MTIYGDLHKLAVEAKAGGNKYETVCMNVAAEILAEVSKALGWPGSQLERAELERRDLSEGATLLPGGWMRNGQYHFIFRAIYLAPFFVQFQWSV
jgi:hypothetical protein